MEILGRLPADLPATILIVVHTRPEGPGLLPRVLTRRMRGMRAVHPREGDRLRHGAIYVAPPDHHIMLGPEERIQVRRGPRENGARPAIDPLFRSAAGDSYGARTIAVVLSGYLDDGSAGLYAVRRRGGIAIVQDPEDALAEDMPLHALQYAGADYTLPANQIGKKLIELVGGHEDEKVVTMKKKAKGHAPQEKQEDPMCPPNSYAAYADESQEGRPSAFACPECSGVLWEIKEGGSVRYRCRTGHAYSEATLNEELSRAAESALWAAMRALEEKASMARRMADAATGPMQWKNRLHEQAQTFAAHAELVRRMIFGEPPNVTEGIALKELPKPERAG